MQTVHCHAEVLCSDLAEAHQRCFRRVVNSKGRETFSACDKEVKAMQKCLKGYAVFPFR